MRKIILLAVLIAVCVLGAASAFAESDYHIGIMTPTVSQAEDDLRGAEALIKMYGDTKDGGMITHVTMPDNFATEVETTIAQLLGLADDPKMKAIIAIQAPEGTTEAFRRIREKRPDILLLVGGGLEDPGVICSAADLQIDVDKIGWAYLIMGAMKKMGADTFVHISFPRHMSMEVIARRVAVFREAAKNMGMKFVLESAPDPTTDVGVAGTQQYLLEKVPAWIEQYGKKTAFFSTNSAHHEPLIKRLISHGGYYAYGDMPSPIRGYPGALNIDLSKEKGNWPAIIAKVEKAVVDAGAAGRMGTWAVSAPYSFGPALGELAKRVIDGKASLNNPDDIIAALNDSSGVKWHGTYYVDAGTGVKMKNFLIVYQDPYVLGKGFLDVSDIKLPDNLFQIK